MARKSPAERGIRHVWLEGVVMTTGIDALDAYTVAVAAVLHVHMNFDGVCWPSVRRIADEAHCSPNVVADRIKLLEEFDLLAVERKPRGKNTYRATLPSVSWGDTGRRRAGAPSVSSDAESVSYQRSSVSREGSICVTGCDVTGNRGTCEPRPVGGTPSGVPAGTVPDAELTPEERTERLEALKALRAARRQSSIDDLALEARERLVAASVQLAPHFLRHG